jgi:hypothetical protein
VAKKHVTKKPAKAGAPNKVPAYAGPSFSELEDQILDWINTLQCASFSLDQSAACGGCEYGAPASNAVRLCAKNLYRLASGLESAVRHGN